MNSTCLVLSTSNHIHLLKLKACLLDVLGLDFIPDPKEQMEKMQKAKIKINTPCRDNSNQIW